MRISTLRFKLALFIIMSTSIRSPAAQKTQIPTELEVRNISTKTIPFPLLTHKMEMNMLRQNSELHWTGCFGEVSETTFGPLSRCGPSWDATIFAYSGHPATSPKTDTFTLIPCIYLTEETISWTGQHTLPIKLLILQHTAPCTRVGERVHSIWSPITTTLLLAAPPPQSMLQCVKILSFSWRSSPSRFPAPPGFHMVFSLPGTPCFLANSSYPGVPADMALLVEDLGSQPRLPGAAWTPSPYCTMIVWCSLPESVVKRGLSEGRGLCVT